MSLPVTCPQCAFKFPLAAGLNDADARRFAAAMGQVPPLFANELLRYFNLFKPATQNLTWAKALKQMNKVLPDIQRGFIKHAGRDWQAPSELWLQGINTMLEKQHELELPMTSHKYLYKVMAGEADKVEGKQETKIEKERQHAHHRNKDSEELIKLKNELAYHQRMADYGKDNKDYHVQQVEKLSEQIKRYQS